MVSRSPDGAAFTGQTTVQLREIMAQKVFIVTSATGATRGYVVRSCSEGAGRFAAIRPLRVTSADRLPDLGPLKVFGPGNRFERSSFMGLRDYLAPLPA
jgi:hypothetical protein